MSNIIDSWLEENGDPEIDQFISKNLAISHKVKAVLKSKEMSNQDFAELLGKSPSEVSKWLGGMHNLTLRSIAKMEVALGVDLIHTEPVKEYEYVYLGTLRNNEQISTRVTEYESSMVEGDSYQLAL